MSGWTPNNQKRLFFSLVALGTDENSTGHVVFWGNGPLFHPFSYFSGQVVTLEIDDRYGPLRWSRGPIGARRPTSTSGTLSTNAEDKPQNAAWESMDVNGAPNPKTELSVWCFLTIEAAELQRSWETQKHGTLWSRFCRCPTRIYPGSKNTKKSAVEHNTTISPHQFPQPDDLRGLKVGLRCSCRVWWSWWRTSPATRQRAGELQSWRVECESTVFERNEAMWHTSSQKSSIHSLSSPQIQSCHYFS